MKLTDLERIADKIKEISAAKREGKTVQFDFPFTGWKDITDDYDLDVGWLKEDRYRIKPEPKLRPWKPEEVPVGAIIRRKNDKFIRWVIWAANNFSIFFGMPTMGAGNGISAEIVFSEHEHSTDGGKTWQPCGVIE